MNDNDDLDKEAGNEGSSNKGGDEGGPCPPGTRWDPELQLCVPIIIDDEPQ